MPGLSPTMEKVLFTYSK